MFPIIIVLWNWALKCMPPYTAEVKIKFPFRIRRTLVVLSVG